MSSPIQFVIDEAKLRGLQVERISAQSRKDVFDKRLLLIDGKRCQVIPSKLGHPNAAYPNAEYHSLYLPTGLWPDFLIYVSLAENRAIFHIVPRVSMSKNTGRSPDSLEGSRDAWELLKQGVPDLEKTFETLSWQLQAIKRSAEIAGIEVEFIHTKKHRVGRRWPPIIKRRVLVAGKKCAVFTAARINSDPEAQEYNYAAFKASKEKWAEFQLYVVRTEEKIICDILVIPRNHLTVSTTASINHPELERYRNTWGLLTKTPEELDRIPPIKWKEPATQKGPTKHYLVLKETLRRAESHGLTVKPASDEASYKGVQNFFYASSKRCQVIESNVITRANGFQSLSLAPSTSEWPDFLIFCVPKPDDASESAFYIIPRNKLPRPTSRSVASAWLKEFYEAWNLLR